MSNSAMSKAIATRPSTKQITNNQRWGIIFITRFPKSHLPRLRHFPLSPTISASNLQSNRNTGIYSWHIGNVISSENTPFLQNFNDLIHTTVSFFLTLYDNLSPTYILFLFITYLFNNVSHCHTYIKVYTARIVSIYFLVDCKGVRC